MTRKVVGAAGVLLGLICLMGANTISYAPNNPIGGKGTINASGSYSCTDPFSSISFVATENGLGSPATVNANAGSWTIVPLSLPAGTYSCVATLYVVQNNAIMVGAQTNTVNVVVN